ncbi:MAG TPA: peroxiredoxin [Methanocella sp.]|nr:peroxiredoxin [Methanocella sp.]
MQNIDSSTAAKDPSVTASSPLKPGATAPDFTLRAGHDKTLKLTDYRGRPVVLVFYPADFSPVCTDELALYNELLPEFQRYNNAAVLGVSVDGVWSHEAFVKSRNLHFPLLSDFEPKGAISRAYGVYREKDGMSDRALFVIDPDGMIWWSYVSPAHVNPGVDGVIKALERLMKVRGGKVAPTTI